MDCLKYINRISRCVLLIHVLIGSFTYNLSKHIASIISPLAGQGDSFVKNSKHFVEVVNDVSLSSEEIMVNFDVKSSFTNVPVEEAVEIISERLKNDG